jgi:hypothetical protein
LANDPIVMRFVSIINGSVDPATPFCRCVRQQNRPVTIAYRVGVQTEPGA